jgi:hypothetical protein
MEHRQRTRLASAAILTVVFATGGLVGMAAERSLSGNGVAAAATETGPQAGPQDDLPGRAAGRGNRPAPPKLYGQVGLSPEALQVADSMVRASKAAADELAADYRHDADSIRSASGAEARSQQFHKDMDSELARVRENLKTLMSPEQVMKYDSLLTAAEDRRRADEQRKRGDRENRPPPDHR